MSHNKGTDKSVIAALMDEGKSIRYIAKALGISNSTAWAHIGNIRRARVQAQIPQLSSNPQAVPEGYHLSSLSTVVDGDGKVKLRSFKVKSGEEGDVVPPSGAFEAPDGMFADRASTLFDGQTGAVKQQWVKSKRNETEQAKVVVAAIKAAFKDEIRVAKIRAPRIANKDLLTVYPMGDPHLGMYAWAEETGTDFDTEIAERNLVTATRRLVDSSPPSEQALIVNVGDFFHADSMENRTMRSHHALDVDTRWAKVLRVGARAMRACIEAALLKHKTVRVINEIGNHDDHTSQMLTLALAMYYEKNPRVTFDESPAKFHYFKFGQVLLGVTHGDTVKPDSLGGIMAVDRPEDWGSSKYRYWLTGHVHNRRVFELNGCLVESFRTLAPRDAWTSASGYRSGRDMQAIVFHREWGERERHHVDAAAIEAK